MTVLYVVDYVEESYGAEMLVGPEELRDRATVRADRILADACDMAAEYGVRPTTVTAFGDPHGPSSTTSTTRRSPSS